MSEARPYGTLLVAGATAIRWGLRKYASTSELAIGSDWTPASGDLQVSKDGGTLTNATNLPVYNGGAWDLIFTAAELTCKQLNFVIKDVAGGPVIATDWGVVETTGNAASMLPDPSDSTPLIATLSTAGITAAQAGLATQALLTTVASYVDTEVAAIKAKTDNLPALPSAVSDIPTTTQILAALASTFGVAQAGGLFTITLAAGASSANGAYANRVIVLIDGTGSVTSRVISSYVGSTKVATVSTQWDVQPDNTSVYVILTN